MRCPNDGSYRGRWIVPVTAPPIHGGYVRFSSGRVTHVGADPPPGPVHDLGDVAILPGLINAHTHLEFSDLAQPIGRAATGGTSMNLADWAAAVVGARGQSATDDAARAAAITAGLDQSQRAGVVGVGEIATAPWPIPRLDATTPRLALFAEILGLSPERQSQTWHWATELNSHLPSTITPGLSPHAPYSTPDSLVRRAVDYAQTHHMPVAMHLAESPEELELLETGQGPFRDALERMGVWREGLFPARGRLDRILRQLAAAPRALVVHGNYLNAEQIAMLARHRRMSVVYCPRTHAYFGHRRHPIADLWRSGIRVALGTDSRASNPDLSIWNEARFLHASRPDLPAQGFVRAITVDAADALGWAELGRFEVGTAPGAVAVATRAVDAANLFESLLDSDDHVVPLDELP